MSKQMKVALNFLTMDEDPANGKEGDAYFNVLSKNLKIHNGSIWTDLTPPSTDPTPFYMHTHAFDGDVHTINVQNQITFLETNVNYGSNEELPIIIGYEGGNPNSIIDNNAKESQTLLDGGITTSEYFPDNNIVNFDGGGSVDTAGNILDGGTSI